jgi:predicted DNA-binding transcriptional regulator YafY
MSRIDRIRQMGAMLKTRGVVSKETLINTFEISLASFKRDLEYLRSRVGMPIIYDRDSGGYRIDPNDHGKRVEIPDLWLSDEEALAMITMHHLLASIDHNGLIAPHVESIQKRLDGVLVDVGTTRKELMQRVRLISIGGRQHSAAHFKAVGAALFGRKRLEIEFITKESGAVSNRSISPQRLIRYRDNWYVDAYCHLKEKLQTFALDGIAKAKLESKAAIAVDSAELDRLLKSSYGIFGGSADKTALLRFTPQRARWVSLERWHSNQVGQFEASGHYLLQIPYSDDRELVMDILKHAPEVTVVGPDSLKKKIRNLHLQGAQCHD